MFCNFKQFCKIEKLNLKKKNLKIDIKASFSIVFSTMVDV